MAVQVAVEEKTVVVKGRHAIRRLFRKTLFLVVLFGGFGLALGAIGLLSGEPVVVGLGNVFLSAVNFYFFFGYYNEVHGNRYRYEYYRRALKPRLSRKSWLEVGVEIDRDEFLKHLNDMDENKFVKPEAVMRNRPYDVVGFSKNDIVTHFWFIGTTGAGKTSTIMTILNDTFIKGGGAIFIDGKSDTKMAKQCYALAKRSGRESDFYLINFLEPEKKRESNTFNVISTFTPSQAVEFLASLLPAPSGDQAYWQERGRSLLKSIVFPLAFRKKYYDEPFSYENLRQGMQWANIVFTLALMDATVKRLEELVAQREKELGLMLKRAQRLGFTDRRFPRVSALKSLFVQYPDEKAVFDQKFPELPDASDFLSDAYEAYTTLRDYINELDSSYYPQRLEFYDMFYTQVADRVLEASVREMRELFDAFLSMKVDPAQGVSMRDVLFSIQKEAIRQLGYGQQQWSNIFTELNEYSHIFGALYPDIDIVDVIRNNKILYVLLPPLEKSQNAISLLGKMILVAVKQATAKALGGNIEMSGTKGEILKSQITPKPLFMIIADEYGSYALQDTETLVAQIRSLNMGMIISTQDYTSSRTRDSFGDHAAKRLWANTKKFILRVEDEETIQKLKMMLEDEYVVKQSVVVGAEGELYEEEGASVQREPLVRASDLPKMKNGLGIFLYEGEAIFCQMFYFDPPPVDIVLNRYTVAI